MLRFSCPSVVPLRLLKILPVVLALSGCDLLAALYSANGARFDYEVTLDTPDGQFDVFLRTPRQITDAERRAGARQGTQKYFVRIAGSFYGCSGGVESCRAIVASYHRDNPPPAPVVPIRTEPEGNVGPQSNSSSPEYDTYVPPTGYDTYVPPTEDDS